MSERESLSECRRLRAERDYYRRRWLVRAELDQLREWQRRNAWRTRTVQHDANDRHIARLESMLKEDA